MVVMEMAHTGMDSYHRTCSPASSSPPASCCQQGGAGGQPMSRPAAHMQVGQGAHGSHASSRCPSVTGASLAAGYTGSFCHVLAAPRCWMPGST